jgi:hypothetical protein
VPPTQPLESPHLSGVMNATSVPLAGMSLASHVLQENSSTAMQSLHGASFRCGLNGCKPRYTDCCPTNGGIRGSCFEQDPNFTDRLPSPLSFWHCCTTYRRTQASCGSRIDTWCINVLETWEQLTHPIDRSCCSGMARRSALRRFTHVDPALASSGANLERV